MCVFVVLGTQHANAHALYFHLWSATLYSIFPHYLLNDTIFPKKKKNVTDHKTRDLIFSTIFISNIFLILRRNERYIIKNVYRSSCKVPVILVRF